MDPTFKVVIDDDRVEFGRSMLIVAAPGEGLVGATAAKHIITTLAMPVVGSIRAAHHAPRSIVRNGRTGHPIRIHLASAVNMRQFRTERLIVIQVETHPDVADQQPLADAIVRWAKEVGVQVIVTPGGVTVDDEALNDKVWGAATSKAGLDILDGLSVDRLEGSIAGLAAGVLNACEEHDVDAICLLAEAAPEYPDAHAAARIIRLLDSMTPSFIISEKPLIEEAERTEREIRATLDAMARGGHCGQKRIGT